MWKIITKLCPNTYSVLYVFHCGIPLCFLCRLLKVDNNGQTQVAESSMMVNEGYRVDLSSASNTYNKANSYSTTQGHTVSSLFY